MNKRFTLNHYYFMICINSLFKKPYFGFKNKINAHSYTAYILLYTFFKLMSITAFKTDFLSFYSFFTLTFAIAIECTLTRIYLVSACSFKNIFAGKEKSD